MYDAIAAQTRNEVVKFEEQIRQHKEAMKKAEEQLEQARIQTRNSVIALRMAWVTAALAFITLIISLANQIFEQQPTTPNSEQKSCFISSKTGVKTIELASTMERVEKII